MIYPTQKDDEENTMSIPVIILIVLVIVVVFLDLKQRSKSNELDLPYERRYLLTKNEWYFYKQLKPIADKYGYTILAKIRLADLVQVKQRMTKSEYSRYFAKIRAKHIDFTLCNPENLAPVLLIELDDKSHKTPNREKRDNFVDAILVKCGYQIIHTYGTGDLENKIKTILENPSLEI